MGRPVTPLLLALDIDGTLLRSDKNVSERTLRALEASRALGVRLCLVTGRRYPAARRVAESLGGGLPLILHNGALTVLEGEPIRCIPLGLEAARRAVRIGLESGVDPVLHLGRLGEGQLVVQRLDPSNRILFRYLDRARPDLLVVDDLEAFLDTEPVQVMFGGAIAEMDRLAGALAQGLGTAARLERTVYVREGVGLIDVLNPGVGKAEALRFLRNVWGLEARNTLAIGDNWNDREMLEEAGLGLVMGNADPGMHRLGLGVLPTNDEDGVAVAIERHILGAL